MRIAFHPCIQLSGREEKCIGCTELCWKTLPAPINISLFAHRCVQRCQRRAIALCGGLQDAPAGVYLSMSVQIRISSGTLVRCHVENWLPYFWDPRSIYDRSRPVAIWFLRPNMIHVGREQYLCQKQTPSFFGLPWFSLELVCQKRTPFYSSGGDPCLFCLLESKANSLTLSNHMKCLTY